MTDDMTQRAARGRAHRITSTFRRFVRSRPALVGGVLLTFLLIVAAIGELIIPFDPRAISTDTLRPPSGVHLMGTDLLGRDVFSRLVVGTRVTLMIGFGAALISLTIGTLIGAAAGFYGGWVDSILMRVTEFFQILPTFFLAILIVALFGRGIDRVIIVIGILSWPGAARLARGQFLAVKNQPFVEAAYAIGLSRRTIIFGEILPNASAPLIIQGTLNVAAAILLEASLGFLGLGDPDALTWGAALTGAQQYMTSAVWLAVFPGIAISLAVLAFNLAGDGLNDALNPRLRHVRA